MTTEEIYKYLLDKELYTEVSERKLHGIRVVEVHIEWGDWKHEHGYCDYLMEELGYKKLGDRITEEDGSDCYSAVHFFVNI